MDYISRICKEECSRYIRSLIKEAELKKENRKVILAIKPEYVEKIFNQTKKYEYRKVMFNPDYKTVYVYASKPVSRIVGSFTVGNLLEGTPSSVWRKTSKEGGVTRQHFNEYFKDHDKAYAIQIKKPKLFKRPIEPESVIKDFRAPQNFCYTEVVLR